MADKLQLLLEAERRGILPPEQKAMLDEARKRGLVDTQGAFGDAMRQAPADPVGTIDAPEFRGQLGGGAQTFRAFGAFALGDDNDAAREYAKAIPGGSVVPREGGSPLIRDAQGRTFEVNPQGFDLTDVGKFFGKAVSFLPAARGAAAFNSLGPRVVAGGLLSSGTEAASQAAIGREKIDPMAVGMAGAGGAVGEVIAPFLQAVFRDAGRLPRQEAIRRARAYMMANASDIPGEVLAQIGGRLDEVSRGGSIDDLIGEAEFGFQYTRGQRSGDIRTLMSEEPLMQTPRMVEVSRNNADAANRAVTNIARRVAGGEVDTAPGAVARATDVVRAEERALRGKVNDAYSRFRETRAYVPDHEAWNVPKRVQRALEDFDVNPATTPNAARAIDIVNETFANTQTALSARQIDVARRKLRSLGVANAADGKARNIIIKEMDQWLDDAVQNGLVNGDPQAIQFLKDARKLNTEMARRFGDMGIGKDVDRIVGRMLQ